MTVTTPSIDHLFDRVKHHISLHRTDVAASLPRIPRGHFSETVYDRIEEAELLADSTTVQPFLSPVKTPVVGALWQRMRLAAHRLVIFYVNRHAGAQIAFNREVAGGLRELVQELDEDNGPASALELAMLRAEIMALHERLARLEEAQTPATHVAE
jgi:hypothetical protein